MSRAKELEKELTGQQATQDINVEAGRRQVVEGSSFQAKALRTNRIFNIKQGIRRRHPDHVLHEFAGVADTTNHANTAWEKALIYEDERTEMDPAYVANPDSNSMVTQLGASQAARKNFKKSTNRKLGDLHLVGV